jgi:hypothetical protein
MPVGSSRPSRRVDTRVIYDRETGEILHIHQAVVLPGVRFPDENELRASAIDLASRNTGTSREQLDVIRVQEEDLKTNTKYQVDVQNKCLIVRPGKTVAET